MAPTTIAVCDPTASVPNPPANVMDNGTTSGNRIAMVVHDVPVANAMKAETTNTDAGKSAVGSASDRIEAR